MTNDLPTPAPTVCDYCGAALLVPLFALLAVAVVPLFAPCPVCDRRHALVSSKASSVNALPPLAA